MRRAHNDSSRERQRVHQMRSDLQKTLNPLLWGSRAATAVTALRGFWFDNQRGSVSRHGVATMV